MHFRVVQNVFAIHECLIERFITNSQCQKSSSNLHGNFSKFCHSDRNFKLFVTEPDILEKNFCVWENGPKMGQRQGFLIY